MTDITIAIPARNASATVARAIRSALSQGDCPILLVNDWSDDDTERIARSEAGSRLTVVSPPEHRTVGLARQTGLLAVETPYLVWLDADDELLPGRVARMRQAFRQDAADIVCDGVEMIDGSTGRRMHVASIPPFLDRTAPLTRQFERNYLPGVSMIGLCVAFARSVGYDGDLHGGEDSDFLLRCAFKTPRVRLLPDTGYRMYAYPTSLSRGIEAQHAGVRRSLEKYRYEDVRQLFEDTGYPPAIARWSLVSMAVFRDDFARALLFLDEIEAASADPALVIEPDGPSPYQEGWRLAFHRGTLELLVGRNESAGVHLETAERMRPTAEGANNLGVAHARTGRMQDAAAQFALSLDRFAGFLDARLNLEGRQPLRITTHPLRRHRIRDDYVPANATPGAAGSAPPSG